MAEMTQWCLEWGGLKSYSMRKNIQETSQYFDFMDSICDLSLKIVSAIHGQPAKCDRDWESLYKRLTVSLTLKSITTFISIENLLDKGSFGNVEVLLRTVFETLINIAYIKTSPQCRAKLYDEYSIIERHKMLRYLKESPDSKAHWNSQEGIKRIEETETYFEAIKGNYRKSKNGKILSWSGKNLRAMAYETGFGRLYDHSYKFLSQFVHSSPISAAGFIRSRQNEFILCLLPESEEISSKAKRLIKINCIYLLAIMHIFNEVFNIQKGEKIDTATDRLKELFK